MFTYGLALNFRCRYCLAPPDFVANPEFIYVLFTQVAMEREQLNKCVWACMRACWTFKVFVWRSIGTFARALDCTSTVRQPSLHMSAAAASRDITLVLYALDIKSARLIFAF